MATIKANYAYKFIVSLENFNIQKNIYSNIDFSKKTNKEAEKGLKTNGHSNCAEKEIENLYFTEDVKNDIKKLFCDMIMSGEIDLDIECMFLGKCYIVEESELLENIIKIK